MTNTKEGTLKKLIWDTCNKTTFTANRVVYEQTDMIRMVASFGPALANNIMRELERFHKTIELYSSYVDDKLCMVKP